MSLFIPIFLFNSFKSLICGSPSKIYANVPVINSASSFFNFFNICTVSWNFLSFSLFNKYLSVSYINKLFLYFSLSISLNKLFNMAFIILIKSLSFNSIGTSSFFSSFFSSFLSSFINSSLITFFSSSFSSF